MNNKNISKSELINAITSAQKGDETAFELLYEYYFSPLYKYVLIRTGDPQEADDLTQLVFIKFYRNLANWQDKGFAPSAYLYTVARSVLADHYRKKSKQGSKITNSEDVLLAISDKSQNPHQDVIDNEQLQHLYQNLQQLPQNYQEVLTLRYIEGLSSLEIAKIIGKNDAATRKQLSRAVAALAKKSKNYRENNI